MVRINLTPVIKPLFMLPAGYAMAAAPSAVGAGTLCSSRTGGARPADDVLVEGDGFPWTAGSVYSGRRREGDSFRTTVMMS